MVEFTYKNISSRMLVIKCIGSNRFFFEKVVFPNEILNILAPKESKIEVWGLEAYGPKLEKRIRVAEQRSNDIFAA